MRNFLYLISICASSPLLFMGCAFAKVPVEIAVGTVDDQGSFNARGYGVLVRYQGQCLMVTLAHVVGENDDDVELADVTVRKGKVISSVEYVDHNGNDDVFIGRVSSGNPLSQFCGQTADLNELNEAYVTALSGMLTNDFNSLQLHSTPSAIDLVPRNNRTLSEARRKEPLRYHLAKCTGADGSACRRPAQKDSGSVISTPVGGGDRLWLGLHQRQCQDACADKEPVWQAVTVMQIYAFLTSPYSQLSAPIEQTRAATVGPSWRDSPEGMERAREVRRVMFDWDTAFAVFLEHLRTMNFPQESDGICSPKCSIWQLRKFYGNELNPSVLDAFKADFTSLGPMMSDMLNVTEEVPTALTKEKITNAIQAGKKLNDAIDETQTPGRQLSLGGQLGFAVNGTPSTWIKFYGQIPIQYQIYTSQVQTLFEAYCQSFKPTVEIKLASSSRTFIGDLSAYKDPCKMKLPWTKFVEGTPDFVLSRLKDGLSP